MKLRLFWTAISIRQTDGETRRYVRKNAFVEMYHKENIYIISVLWINLCVCEYLS